MNVHEKRSKKLEWLITHRYLWEDLVQFIQAGESLYMGHRSRIRTIWKELVAAGLMSPSTALIDSRIDDMIWQAHKKLEAESQPVPIYYSARKEGLFPLPPDYFCVTEADGNCVSTDPRCMHWAREV